MAQVDVQIAIIVGAVIWLGVAAGTAAYGHDHGYPWFPLFLVALIPFWFPLVLLAVAIGSRHHPEKRPGWSPASWAEPRHPDREPARR